MSQPFKAAAEAATGNTYVWIPNSGSTSVPWTSPAQWQDTTTGTTGQSAPGAGSVAVVDSPPTVTANFFGGGSAADVTLDGLVGLTGAYSFGHISDLGNLDLDGSLVANSMNVYYAFLAGSTLTVKDTLRITNELYVAVSSSSVSDVRVGRLVLASTPGGSSPEIFVAGASSVEIGDAGHATAGELTVDAGATLAGTGAVAADMVDNGLVDARRQLFMQSVTGTGVVKIDGDSTATVYSVGANDTIDFAGPGAMLDVDGMQGAFGPATTVSGFGLGNAVLFENLDISTLTRTSTGGRTILTLGNTSGQTEDQVTLAGDQSNLAFTLLSNPGEEGGVLLVALPAVASVAAAALAPETAGHHFVWTGQAGTGWGDSENWRDVSQPGSTAVPGTLDTATVRADRNGFTLVSGSGGAASLSFSGNVVFDGSFDIGTLEDERRLGAASLTLVGADSTMGVQRVRLSTGYLSITGGAVVQATTAGEGTYYLSNGAMLTAKLLQDAFVTVDSTSRVEVGGSTSGALGVLTIDAGATARNIIIGGTVVDNGRLVTNGVTFAYAITGSGEILIRHGGLSLQSGLDGRLVQFTGSNAELTLVDTAAPTMNQAISGFGVSDEITVWQATDAESFLHYTQGASGGVLEIVTATGSILDSLDLAGQHDPSYFLLSQQGMADTISVLPGHIDHQVSPGTASGNVFAWSGTVSPGSWSDAAAWKDLTTGTTATVAPGLHDTVDLNQAYVGNVFVTGAASIADLEVSFDSTLDGSFVADAVNEVGLSLVGPGTTLQAQQLIANISVDFPYLAGLIVDRAHVTVGTADLLGYTDLRDGGFLSADTLSFADLAIDPTSRALLGTASGGIASLQTGALTVEAGETLQNATLLEGGLVADGAVDVRFRMEVTGAVSGKGTFAIGSSLNASTVALDGSVSAAMQIDLVADEASVVYRQATGGHGEVSGFAIGDAIDFTTILNATQVSFQAAGAAGGELVIEDQNDQTLASVHLLGDYRAASFAVSEASGFASVTLTASHQSS